MSKSDQTVSVDDSQLTKLAQYALDILADGDTLSPTKGAAMNVAILNAVPLICAELSVVRQCMRALDQRADFNGYVRKPAYMSDEELVSCKITGMQLRKAFQELVQRRPDTNMSKMNSLIEGLFTALPVLADEVQQYRKLHRDFIDKEIDKDTV